jgi:hypothetical protein
VTKSFKEYMDEAEEELERQRESYYHKEWSRLASGFQKNIKQRGKYVKQKTINWQEKPVQRSIFRP